MRPKRQVNQPTGTEDLSTLPRIDAETIHPNPFSQKARIAFRIEKSGRVLVTIHNGLGQTVATLHDDVASAGRHTLEWVPSNQLASGAYLVRFESAGSVVTQMAVLLRK